MSQPALRVFAPQDQDPQEVQGPPGEAFSPSADWTLLDFYLHYVRPRCLKHRSPKTHKQYEIALWRWWQATTGWAAEALGADQVPRSVRPEPRLRQITDEICQDFVDAMHDAGTGPATLHKWATHLNYCLLRAGPRIGSKRHFARLVDDPGLIEPPPIVGAGAKPGYTLEEIWYLLQSIRKRAKPLPAIARWDPRIWWRAAVIFAYNTGPRPETLFQLEWEHFSADDRDRDPDGSMRVMKIPAAILKGRRQPQTIWLNDAAFRAIEPLRRPTGRIFGWPWPKAETTLGRALGEYLDLAGVAHGRAENLPYGWYGFRRAFSRECLGIAKPGAAIAAPLMLNHRIPGLTILLQHYSSAIGILREVLPYLPQPRGLRQKTLF